MSARRSDARKLLAVLVAFSSAVLPGCAARYAGQGVVVATAPDRREVTVSHAPIPGYMDAMVMPFTVRDERLLSGVTPGDLVTFQLVVSRSASFLDRLEIVSAARTDVGLTQTPVRPVLVSIGEPMPEFSLVNQTGTRIALSSLRGQVVLVTFIYTRCPLPDYCPRLMVNFADVKEKLGDQLGRDVTLLTITFDPKYDTSEVMARYGASFGAGVAGWHLLTGPPDEIQRVTEAFGIEFWPDEGLITHTLQTAVIDREGRLFAAIEGKDYSTTQLMDVVAAALAKPAGTEP